MRAIIILALVGTALAVPMSSSRIVGGTETSIEEYPFMVNVMFGWFGSGFSQHCGGSLIRETSVLSAAHCYPVWPVSWWRAVVGTSYRSSGGTALNVARIINHENYGEPVLDNDVSILQLTSPAVLSNTVQLARIAGPNYILADGTSITALGWGDTTSGGSPSEVLRRVDLDIINQELCAERYAYLKTQPGYQRWPDISDGMLCAGILDVGGKDACQGDSGGPVAHQGDVIVGITSWGFECADSFYPGVNARVSYYSEWIQANA